MEETHNKKTKQEIMEMYPTGTYYICANSLSDNPNSKYVRQVENAENILGIQHGKVIYGENRKGCLFYYGIWALICDENGDPLGTSSSEPNYEIY